jgi:NAD(P)-dependent dehydrogenase (short-subunit alcohol dehydrogenase family)
MSGVIGTTSEQAYGPIADLYDYAQTEEATMNYIRSLAKRLGPKGVRADGMAPGPIWTSLQVSGCASMETLDNFGGQTEAGRGSQLNWREFMCNSLPMMAASLRGLFTPHRAA